MPQTSIYGYGFNHWMKHPKQKLMDWDGKKKKIAHSSPDQRRTGSSLSASHRHKQSTAPSSRPKPTHQTHSISSTNQLDLKQKSNVANLCHEVADDSTIVDAHPRTVSVEDPSNPHLWKKHNLILNDLTCSCRIIVVVKLSPNNLTS